jgi:hypothetical protein
VLLLSLLRAEHGCRIWGLYPGCVARSACVLVLVLAAAAATACSGSRTVAATMRAAGCSYREATPYAPKHDANYHADFPTPAATPHWSTFPPSGGGHYRLWATWGFYRRPVNPALVVHNEEHGGVVIWWGPQVPAATVARLKRFYEEQPVGVFGTPLPGLGRRIALTAWTADPHWQGEPGLAYLAHHYGTGHVAICPRFDEHAFAAFRDAYRGHSPQGFPLADDRPGCGPDAGCPPKRSGQVTRK